MIKYYLAVLSEYEQQEGYLDLALQNLIEIGKATTDPDWNRNYLINIVYDGFGNPYLLFKAENLQKVKKELKKRFIIPEGAFEFRNLDSVVDHLLNDRLKKIHKEIQEKYSQDLLYTICDQ